MCSSNKWTYRTAGKFGGVFNFAVWQSRKKNAKLKTTNIKPRDPSSGCCGTESPNLKYAKFKNTVFWLELPNLMPATLYGIVKDCLASDMNPIIVWLVLEVSTGIHTHVTTCIHMYSK